MEDDSVAAITTHTNNAVPAEHSFLRTANYKSITIIISLHLGYLHLTTVKTR